MRITIEMDDQASQPRITTSGSGLAVAAAAQDAGPARGEPATPRLGQLKQLMRELLPRQSRKSWIKVGPRLAPIRQGRGVGFDPDSYLSQPGNGSNYPCTCGLCAGFLR